MLSKSIIRPTTTDIANVKIQKKSPWLAKILQQQAATEQPIEWNFPQYANYIESGKPTVGMKDWIAKQKHLRNRLLHDT